MIGARLTAGVALASIKLWPPFHQSNLTKSLKIS
jgi:hypothetical protein